MKILIIYSRDIDIEDSGGARTTIQLANYLSSKKDVECFCLFKIKNGNQGKIIEIHEKGNYLDILREVVIKNNIDIVLIPEALSLSTRVSSLLKGCNCKIVSALHSMPGYEKIRLYVLLLESLVYNDSILKRFRSALLLSIYPVFYYIYINIQKNKMLRAYESSARFVLLSAHFFDNFIKSYNIKDGGKKLVDIGNGLSFDTYATDKDINSKRKQCLVVARLDERAKQISIVFRIWKELQQVYPDWELIIVGFGRSYSYYKYLSKKLDLSNVVFVGKADPLEYYKNSSLFFMTSAYEGWGMTLTEAQQLGCIPIALNRFSSLMDIIETNQTGYIVNSIDEFTQTASRLMSDSVLREMLAYNAIEAVRKFEKNNIYEKYYAMFLEILNNER
jgi:glycosyltransferase involved in cell wall biosynthesis